MPTYNAAEYIGQAVDSVLSQTCEDFELLIIDDGSTDQTRDILARYSDPRIRVLSRENRGLGATLREGVQLSKGRYIARMDADDECVPERLEVQRSYLASHPDCGMVHSWADVVDAEGRVVTRKVGKRVDSIALKWQLIWKNAIIHPTVMIKADVLEDHDINYDDALRSSEDLDLWNRLARVTDIEFVPKALLRYRTHGDSFTASNRIDFHFDYFVRVLKWNFSGYGLNLDQIQVEELAVISENTKVDPRTYRYQALENDLLTICHQLQESFCEFHGIEGDELDRIQGEQFLNWSRYMLNTSRPFARELLLSGLRKNGRILLRKFFWLVCADVYANLKLRPV